jgi:hypothetical protein
MKNLHLDIHSTYFDLEGNIRNIYVTRFKVTYSIHKMTTENGAMTLLTTGDARLDLFSKINRDTPETNLHAMLFAAWSISPLDTLKIVFHLRDCRGGKGEREQFYRALRWLMTHHCAHLQVNLRLVPFFGRFKDLLIFLSTPLETPMLVIYTDQLRTDASLLSTPNVKHITLAAKYAPSEGGSYDRNHQAVAKFAKTLGCDKKTYRKEWLVPLRKQIDTNSTLVEHHMTDKPEDWATIDFSKVSSVALKKYKKAWIRHEPTRYASYLESVKKGNTKMNVLRLMPHEIVSPYLRCTSHKDETIETQWFSFVEQTRKTTKFKGALAVVDVSGSMNTGDKVRPIDVAVSLGLLLAHLTEGPFHGKFFTFSSAPVLEMVKGDTLYEQVRGMHTAHWDLSTNIEAVFDTLLSSARAFGCSNEQLPKTIFIFSDMQFNVCTSNASQTNWDSIKFKYGAAGYTLPRLVFWNLRGNTVDFPVNTSEKNVALLGGFSADLLRMIIDGEDLNPLELMFKTIHAERYAQIKLSPVD